MRQGVALCLIALTYFVMACFYNAVTPFRTPGILLNQRAPDGSPQKVIDVGAPDEKQHANYIAHLLDGKGFPILRPGSAELAETYQSHQPPLYYLFSAGWCKLLNLSPSQKQDGFKVRLLNTLFGLGTIFGVYFAALWGLGRKDIALGSCVFVAFLPMFLSLNAAVSNDPLLYCLCTWCLALCTLANNVGWNLRLAAGIGFVTGLAFLTKTSALGLMPMLLIALGFCWTRVSRRQWLFVAALTVGLPVIIALPWWLRNQALYGDPLAMKVFQAAFVGSPQAEMFIQSFGPLTYWTQWVGWWTARSFFGVFGYMDIFWDNKLYGTLIAFSAFLAIGWVFSFRAASTKEPGSQNSIEVSERNQMIFHVLSGALTATMLGLFIQFNATYFQGQARYLFPALAPIAIGLVSGLAYWLKRYSHWSAPLLMVVLLLLNIATLILLPAEFAKRVI